MKPKQSITSTKELSAAIASFVRPVKPSSKHWCEVKVRVSTSEAQAYSARLREEGWCFTTEIDGDHTMFGLCAVTDAYALGTYDRA